MHTVTRNTNETRNSFNKRDSNKNLTDNCRFLCQENNYYKISLVYYIILYYGAMSLLSILFKQKQIKVLHRPCIKIKQSHFVHNNVGWSGWVKVVNLVMVVKIVGCITKVSTSRML